MPALGMLGDPALPKVFGQVVQALASQGAPPPVAEQQALQQLMVIPPMQEKITTNQIDQIDMDIALDEAPETLTLIQEQFDGLIKLAMNGMQIPPELIIEASSLPNKKRLLEMLRRPQTPDPQQQQVQAEAQQIAKASAVANLQKVQADAHRSEATAKKTEAEIGLVPGEAQAKQAAAAVDVAKAREMSRPELLIAMPAREGSGGGRYGGGTAGA